MIKNIRKEIDIIYDKVVGYRRFLHQNPELGFNLEKTCKFVSETLLSFGIEPIKCGVNGIVCYIGSSNDDCILLRADMDALNVKEEVEITYKSTNDYMHACAHDMHTAMLLGAAYILKKYESKLKRKVKLLFQPAEEILAGAKEMVENGVLDGVSEAYMIHVLSLKDLETGKVIIGNEGVAAPSSDFFEIIVEGKSSHGAMPEKGVDPIMIASYIVTCLNEIVARETGFNERAVITIGSFNSGNSNNVIPDKAILKGSFRCFDEKIREFIKRRISELTEKISDVFNGRGTVNFTNGCPCLINNKDLREKTRKILIDNNVNIIELIEGERSSGSEDFSYISQKVPSLLVGIVSNGDYPLHSSKVVFDEEVLKEGMLIYLLLGFENK